MTHARIQVGTGSFEREELIAAFASIPADITFVDAEGIVRYFSTYRIFSRPPDSLDRPVLDCHGDESRPAVARMLSEFASGWRDEATFLEHKDGREASVRYVALRGPDDAYLGCLEIAQWADSQAATADD